MSAILSKHLVHIEEQTDPSEHMLKFTLNGFRKHLRIDSFVHFTELYSNMGFSSLLCFINSDKCVIMKE